MTPRISGLRPLLLILFKLTAILAAAAAVYVFWLPDVAPLKSKNPTTTTYMALRERQAKRAGKPFSKSMIWAASDEISEHLKHAVIIAEDDMFYVHKGVDWEGVRAALERDWKERQLAYGGSSITQQVAKNLYLSPARNPLRKIKEVLIAWRLEKTLGKRRILEIYLNIAEWGKGIYGIEAAARAYFGKSAAELTPEESAALAAVLPNPRRYNPASNSRYVARNSERILNRMRGSGYLPDEFDQAWMEQSFEQLTSTGTETTINISTFVVSGPQEQLPP